MRILIIPERRLTSNWLSLHSTPPHIWQLRMRSYKVRHTLDPTRYTQFVVRLFRDVMAALSPNNVVTALQTLPTAKTRELAIRLGVQVYVLDNIDDEHRGTTRSTKYVQAWLDSDTHASWKKLVSRLRDIDMNVLAEEVESTYVSKSEEASVPTASLTSATPPPRQLVSSPAGLEAAPVPVSIAMTTAAVGPLTPALNPTQSPAVNMARVAEVRAEIEKFKDEFFNLKFDAQSFLSKKESQDVKF